MYNLMSVAFSTLLRTPQAEQSDEEEDEEEEEAYDYLSPFLPTLTGTQELNRDQVRHFIPLSPSSSGPSPEGYGYIGDPWASNVYHPR